MTTGEKIKELRSQKGMTQEDLAAKTDLSVRTIQRIENGEVVPRAYTIQTIARALEVDFEDLQSDAFETHKVQKESKEHIWLPLVHLSAYFLFIIPTAVIWILKKEEIENINTHARDVINFQISLSIYMIVCLICIPPFFVLLVIYHFIIIMINTVKVIQEKPYYYPLVIRFIKA